MFWILGMVAALALGVYIGLGMPGLPSRRKNRRVRPGTGGRSKLDHNRIDWLRSKRRASEARRR